MAPVKVRQFFHIRSIIFVVFGLVVVCSPSSHLDSAIANPIFVYRQADGTIRFSTRKPAGVDATRFTAKGAASSYSKSRIGRTRIYPNKYDSIILGASRRHMVDPALIKAVIHAESSFNPRAVSNKGAMGLMQLMPATAKWLGVEKPYSVYQNINGGVKYLSNLLRRHKGSIVRALAAYNAGDVAVKKYNGVPPYKETRRYIQKVLSLRDRYRNTITS